LIDAGIKAIFVGCYAEGFDEKWLGRTIDKEAAEDLKVLRKKYGISVIGEGGEFESLTTDSPMFSRPLSILDSKTEWKNGSGTLFVKKVSLSER
jgi:uncharacterized protein (TIGR00290 family)